MAYFACLSRKGRTKIRPLGEVKSGQWLESAAAA